MNKTLEFDFSVDKANRTITVKREYEAELPIVWDAFTKSEILDQWWAPKPWKARTNSLDFREGGRWHYAMVGPKGEEQHAIFDIKTVQPQKRFVGIDAFADDKGKINTEMPRSNWETTFTSRGDLTLVTSRLTFDDVDQLEKLLETGFKEGLTAAMENLDALLPSLKKSRG